MPAAELDIHGWAGPEALPGVVGVDHIGLAVTDLEAAVRLHTEVLGLRVEHRETNPDQGVVEVMLAASDTGAPATQLQLRRSAGRALSGAPFPRPARPGSAPPGVRGSAMSVPHPAFSCGRVSGCSMMHRGPVPAAR